MAASDYILPEGRLQEAMLPGHDLAAYVEAWEAQGQVLATAGGLSGDSLTEAVAAYVYWRGYSVAAEAIAARPASERVGEAARSHNEQQYQFFMAQAAGYRKQYQTLIGATNTAIVPTVSVPLRPGF